MSNKRKFVESLRALNFFVLIFFSFEFLNSKIFCFKSVLEFDLNKYPLSLSFKNSIGPFLQSLEIKLVLQLAASIKTKLDLPKEM